ncbi:ScbR family autoregulator-binding transcription factor [Mycolicibacterium fortuitum]|uniref:ScbR family autoregulator-binding transcription factor n=2 Tax=Mycolicibacterium fortuitum TaxID=1766 RepID=A0AAE4V8R9_MYCFO|nr:ScbR family autoregulator-binding transcription factor [Mycolicibacterium fortuitum]MCV7142952.1 TetR/AcrR family transcriptional regulator [Mycolicibacterium fortuitum]MDV7189216.1 ScbR family autoregulator-binding transcription factor [Mycolicibacterium fortuitum]MDV7202747.1 ScbR family autoregulator-binding transcription factor [Mycolicibacterium fortuitum]MDV7224449.1 ScbR family autoregulator-binding transcription factor [Mycolicibacterium fortuitum]MDV7256553.1 ScbR family autoregula
MARQARSELTRQKIITAAVDLFSEHGYPATGLGDIIARAEMTKGALYYHFDSKESLAEAIIDDGGSAMLGTFRVITETSSPALENTIHGLFVVADFTRSDRVAQIGMQLLRTFSGINAAATRVYTSWLDELTAQLNQAADEGDLREGLDIAGAAEVILGSMLGAEALSRATATGTDLRERVARTWDLLLPAVVSRESLDYFREFLGRESLRRTKAAG